ncbi:LLM class flavin-dependent oxidoreductase [Gordonia sp. Z-3]|uniref:LLM class flavin-dependent oxidoreductase n=1 Tax=Gordonia sp. Z-3 TaxID=3115408 RepID=UPI003FA5DA36
MTKPWSDVLNDMLSIVDAAEDLGFEGVAINENVFQNYVTNPSSLTFSAVAAMRTKRIRILPGVVVLPSYNPLLVASEMSLLDHLAPGRVGIGVARGGGRYQLDRIGVDPAEARAIYEESLDIIRRLWTEDDVVHDGKYYSFPETTIVPKPVTKPHPELWVASQSVQGVKKVAEQGLNLVTAPNYGSFEPHGDLETLLGSYDDAVTESGNPRGEVMVYRHTWLGHTEEEAEAYFDDFLSEYNHYLAFTITEGERATREGRLAARGLGDGGRRFVNAGKVTPESESPNRDNLFERYDDPVLTTPDRMIERFQSYEKMGVDHLACLIAVGQPIEEIIKNMELMAKEVLPAFA